MGAPNCLLPTAYWDIGSGCEGGGQVSKRRRAKRDPDQYDLFEPHHECCEDGRGPYHQYLIAPPTELGEPGPWAADSTGRGELELAGAVTSS